MGNRIKLFVTDIDGTMTNGQMIFDHQGNVSKAYHTRDVTALYLLANVAQIPVMILSGSNHSCDVHRFKYLSRVKCSDPFDDKKVTEGLHDILFQNIFDKVGFLSAYLKERGIDWEDVAFIGDGENDLDVMRRVGWSACPADAHPDAKYNAKYLCKCKGGHGAVSEFAYTVMRTMDVVYNDGKLFGAQPVSIEIYVNTRKTIVGNNSVSYEDIVRIAHGSKALSGPVQTVTFCKGICPRTEGSLLPGETVKIAPGMRFDAGYTGNA